jgi:hypothetical protein
MVYYGLCTLPAPRPHPLRVAPTLAPRPGHNERYCTRQPALDAEGGGDVSDWVDGDDVIPAAYWIVTQAQAFD